MGGGGFPATVYSFSGCERAVTTEPFAIFAVNSLSVPEAPQMCWWDTIVLLLHRWVFVSFPVLASHQDCSRGYSVVFQHKNTPSYLHKNNAGACIHVYWLERGWGILIKSCVFLLSLSKIPELATRASWLSEWPEQSGLTTPRLAVMSASALGLSLHINHPADSGPAGSPRRPWWIRKRWQRWRHSQKKRA